VDYSETLGRTATEFVGSLEGGAFRERFQAMCGSLEDVGTRSYDLIFAGEIAEHFLEPERFLSALEARCRKDGRVFITIPQGPFTELMDKNSLDWSKHHRGHRFHFEARDLDEMLAHKPGYTQIHLPIGETPRGATCGHYLVTWRADRSEIRAPNLRRKIRRTRPHETLAVCMIAQDAEHDILRCLKSADTIADEIWVADTGSTDATMELARPYTRNGGDVWSIGVCPDAPDDLPAPRDFGWARNQSISRTTADWILWIDTDELLERPEAIGKYLTDSPFNGYALRQCHVMKDAPFRFDKPVRLFRRVPVGKQTGVAYRCFAVIHEHFQAGVNELIEPVLLLNDADIIHTGYLNEPLRRFKCRTRNQPLTRYDREKYPQRVLGKLLEVREVVNTAKWELEARGRVVALREPLLAGLETLTKEFFDPSGPYWEAVFEVYQDILRLLDAGHDYLVADVDGSGEMGARKLRFRDDTHYQTYLNDVVRRIEALRRLPAIDWDDAHTEHWQDAFYR
jgi:glycosyltransferase involved in cell wall biosynthesis